MQSTRTGTWIVRKGRNCAPTTRYVCLSVMTTTAKIQGVCMCTLVSHVAASFSIFNSTAPNTIITTDTKKKKNGRRQQRTGDVHGMGENFLFFVFGACFFIIIIILIRSFVFSTSILFCRCPSLRSRYSLYFTFSVWLQFDATVCAVLRVYFHFWFVHRARSLTFARSTLGNFRRAYVFDVGIFIVSSVFVACTFSLLSLSLCHTLTPAHSLFDRRVSCFVLFSDSRQCEPYVFAVLTLSAAFMGCRSACIDERIEIERLRQTQAWIFHLLRINGRWFKPRFDFNVCGYAVRFERVNCRRLFVSSFRGKTLNVTDSFSR